MTSKHLITSLLIMIAAQQTARPEESPYTVDPVDSMTLREKDTNCMAQTRFGMFVHFGLYSIPAGVWQGEEMGRNHYAEWIRTQWRWPQPDGGIPKGCGTKKSGCQFSVMI